MMGRIKSMPPQWGHLSLPHLCTKVQIERMYQWRSQKQPRMKPISAQVVSVSVRDSTPVSPTLHTTAVDALRGSRAMERSITIWWLSRREAMTP
jgi:hypothetical protein